MDILLVSTDLLTASRVEGAAARAGATFRAIRTYAEASNVRGQGGPQLVFVDLSTPSLDVGQIVQVAKCGDLQEATVIAFGPHVHENRLASAREAGCDRVVSRGQFFAQVDAILADYAKSQDESATR